MAGSSLVLRPKNGADVQGVDASPLPRSRAEKELMILCGFKSPEELAKFLNSPDAPEALRRTRPPDYADVSLRVSIQLYQAVLIAGLRKVSYCPARCA
jgi:hypothetical protein